MLTNTLPGQGKRPSKYLALGVYVAFVVGIGGLQGCGSGSSVIPLPLDSPPDAYRSKDWIIRSDVKIAKLTSGLHCDVQGKAGEEKGSYGGIVLPAGGAKNWRLELAFPDPKDIIRVYVDANNAQKKRVARWETAIGGKLRSDRTTYVFVPQQSTDGFQSVASEGTGPVDKIHVFIRVKPRGRASFDLYSVELAK